jgi:hypothetical protein
MSQQTPTSSNSEKIILTPELIDQITQDLKRMEGQEITKGEPMNSLQSSASLGEGASTLWSISYTTS